MTHVNILELQKKTRREQVGNNLAKRDNEAVDYKTNDRIALPRLGYKPKRVYAD